MKTFTDAMGDGTLKVKDIPEEALPMRFGAFSVAVLDATPDPVRVSRCMDAISDVIEKAEVGVVVGELQQGERVLWYVYATTFETLDEAFESISDRCPLLWGNHHDAQWREYGYLRADS